MIGDSNINDQQCQRDHQSTPHHGAAIYLGRRQRGRDHVPGWARIYRQHDRQRRAGGDRRRTGQEHGRRTLRGRVAGVCRRCCHRCDAGGRRRQTEEMDPGPAGRAGGNHYPGHLHFGLPSAGTRRHGAYPDGRCFRVGHGTTERCRKTLEPPRHRDHIHHRNHNQLVFRVGPPPLGVGTARRGSKCGKVHAALAGGSLPHLRACRCG